MNAPPASDAVRPAAIELAALAAAVRPDWNADIVSGTLRRAHDNGMPWPKVLVNFPRLMADPLADPRDLLKPLESPLAKKPGTEASANVEWRQAKADIDRKAAGAA